MQGPQALESVCRACLNVNISDMIPLTENELQKKFEITTDIKILKEDNLPRRVCLKCSDMIISMYNFRLRCHTSDETLRCYLSKKEIKIEVKIESYENNFEENTDHLDANNEYDCAKSPIPIYILENKDCTTKNESIIKPLDEMQFQNCGLCHINRFENIEELNLHLDTHENDKSCEKCYEVFYDRSDLLCHRYQHLTPNCKYSCHICQKIFKDIDKLEFHLRKNHFSKQGGVCKICNKEFTKLAYLRKHIRYMHSEDKSYSCNVCFKLFKSSHLLHTHAKTHSSEKAFICEECGFACKFRGGLSRHISRRHGPDQKIKCDECDKEFKSKESFADHKKLHSNTACICPTCGKNFKRSALLKRHTLTHMSERPFPCKFCPSRFKSSSQLGNHQRRHTGHRPFKCKYCSSAFFTQNVLIKHTRIHTGEKPYVCTICKKGFTGGNNLKVHMKVHGEHLIVSKREKCIE